MDRSSVITLVSETFTKSSTGVQIPTETETEVFCNVQSVSLQEWSEGGRLGLNPELRFTMFGPDYNGQKIIEYNGVRYSVYRVYYGRNDTIDLYAERRTGDAE